MSSPQIEKGAGIEKSLGDFAKIFSLFLQENIIPAVQAVSVPQAAEPIIYSLSTSGKRIRPYLVFLCAGLEPDPKRNKSAFYVAAAVEAVHTYSLIHDDLPSMDNDSVRRGKPACHIQYSEWAAVLAGDGLNSLAFELLARAAQIDSSLKLQSCILSLARGCGIEGMVAGQALDLSLTKKNINAKNASAAPHLHRLIKEIHNRKTAALFSACCELGALLAGDGGIAPDIGSYKEYGQKLGFLFQIKDDLLDMCEEPQSRGKAAGKDVDKLTYPGVFGVEASRAKCRQLQKELGALVPKLQAGPHRQNSYALELEHLPLFIAQQKA